MRRHLRFLFCLLTFVFAVSPIMIDHAFAEKVERGRENLQTRKTVLRKFEVVNLNTATLDTLMSLPGIGKERGKAILAYRAKIKNFKNTRQIMDIEGIGNKTFENIKDLITTQ